MSAATMPSVSRTAPSPATPAQSGTESSASSGFHSAAPQNAVAAGARVCRGIGSSTLAVPPSSGAMRRRPSSNAAPGGFAIGSNPDDQPRGASSLSAPVGTPIRRPSADPISPPEWPAESPCVTTNSTKRRSSGSLGTSVSSAPQAATATTHSTSDTQQPQISTSNPSIIPCLSHAVDHWISLSGPPHLPASNTLLMFYNSARPSVGAKDYVERLHRYFYCPGECFVLALVYVGRLFKQYPELQLNILNFHRLFFTALVVAVKFGEDEYYSNAFYSKVGGVPLHELNTLEIAFLSLIQFDLYVASCEYEAYVRLVFQNGGRAAIASSSNGASAAGASRTAPSTSRSSRGSVSTQAQQPAVSGGADADIAPAAESAQPSNEPTREQPHSQQSAINDTASFEKRARGGQTLTSGATPSGSYGSATACNSSMAVEAFEGTNVKNTVGTEAQAVTAKIAERTREESSGAISSPSPSSASSVSTRVSVVRRSARTFTGTGKRTSDDAMPTDGSTAQDEEQQHQQQQRQPALKRSGSSGSQPSVSGDNPRWSSGFSSRGGADGTTNTNNVLPCSRKASEGIKTVPSLPDNLKGGAATGVSASTGTAPEEPMAAWRSDSPPNESIVAAAAAIYMHRQSLQREATGGHHSPPSVSPQCPPSYRMSSRLAAATNGSSWHASSSAAGDQDKSAGFVKPVSGSVQYFNSNATADSGGPPFNSSVESMQRQPTNKLAYPEGCNNGGGSRSNTFGGAPTRPPAAPYCSKPFFYPTDSSAVASQGGSVVSAHPYLTTQHHHHPSGADAAHHPRPAHQPLPMTGQHNTRASVRMKFV
eukprot:GHVT01047874.1.p1 GENE.GHVT01047874.1~~GHVT01047874.1.p1  ORF type:complete len:822 (-),score=136.38 GHVT01047874.1:1087-3552(-)